jgi:hypothetical protein
MFVLVEFHEVSFIAPAAVNKRASVSRRRRLGAQNTLTSAQQPTHAFKILHEFINTC